MAAPTQPKPPTSNLKKFENFDWKFETFNDPTLEKMLEIAKKYIQDILNKKYYTLTLSGPTEIGKTHLLLRCFKLLEKMDLYYKYTPWCRGYEQAMFFKWYEITPCLLSRSFDSKDKGRGEELFDQITNCGCLIVEEFLGDDYSNANAFNKIEIQKAHQLIDSRLGKATILDTNKLITDIEMLDVRLASRLKRNEGRFIGIKNTTPKYCTRK